MICIVSFVGDKHTEVVQEKLANLGEESVIIDYALYPHEWQCGISTDKQIILSLANGRIIKGEEIKSVWYRRISGPPRARQTYTRPLINEYVRLESEAFLRVLPLVLDCLWVSNPEAVEIGSLKAYQLAVASALGFVVPDTFLGNSPNHALSFLEARSNRPVVTKTIDMPYVKLDVNDHSKNAIIYTTRVPIETLKAEVQRIANCPIIIQEEVQKEFDLRVTVVGTRVFCAAIDSKDPDLPEIIDWRHYRLPKNYRPHKLPNEIETLCVSLVERLGLVFGCIDLAYTTEDEYVFFEINPAGQWLATEMYTGVPISEALAVMLAKGEII